MFIEILSISTLSKFQLEKEDSETNGIFKPYSVERMHYSRQYYNAPMPWSVFFNGGVAIHATSSIADLVVQHLTVVLEHTQKVQRESII